ncbi:MAG: uridylate kinase [Gammaproteobacteria bacterium]|nr:uridylate kinase [Gammaproteobacteria bacterium]
MVVIKLGGSLMTGGALAACLDKIAQDYQGRAVVIVPGGGIFADQVRHTQQQWRFNDDAAHRMALLAMQQMALLMNALMPQFSLMNKTTSLINNRDLTQPAIWSPDINELDQAGIPATWDITSDSLAAWLAGQLCADELIVVKSVTINHSWSVPKLVRQQVVDAGFNQFIQQTACKLTVVDAKKFLS